MVVWNVTKLIVAPDFDGKADVVAYVQWKAAAGGNVKYGTVGLTAPGEPFVPYAKLTEQMALEWVWNAVNKAEVEAELTSPAAPPENRTEAMPLPWG
ncbi:MAG: hypothetical protein IOD05_16040 [Rhodobacter sp.]|nr:hypothetical protein [Rhodobacter sp.]